MMWSTFSYAYLPSVYLLWWGVALGLLPTFKSDCSFSFLSFSYSLFFLWEGEREESRRMEKGRETSISHLSHGPWPGTEPATQAHVLTWNWTGNPSLCGATPNQPSHTSQGFIFSFNSCFLPWAPSTENTHKALRTLRMICFFKGKLLSVFLLLPFSFSYTCRHLRRYVYVLDKLCFPHSHCSTLQHCFSRLSDNGEELLSLTCSHILRSYASRLLTSAVHLLHAACCVWLTIACFNGIHANYMIKEEIYIWNDTK